MVRVYNIFIRLYTLAIRLAVPFNKKAGLWISGRQNQFTRLKNCIDPSRPLIWMHCASLGEFEQGLPVLERLKKNYPAHFILVSFFSPSGFEIRKNHPVADHVVYLPQDTPYNAKTFINIIRPQLVVFVRYEFWYNYLSLLSKKEVPLFLLSAVFNPRQIFFKPWGSLHRKMLEFFTRIFVQDINSQKLLEGIDINHVEICGDTRIDRVLQVAEKPFNDQLITEFCQNHQIFICGSTWPEDERILIPLINEITSDSNWKVIIAPHDIKDEQIERTENQLKQLSTRYSENNIEKLKDSKILIIDNIGLLSSIYRFGRIAYIGGGFGVSVHNILEALVYEIPVIFGPKYRHINEACLMVNLGTAIPVNGKKELKDAFRRLTEDARQSEIQSRIRAYISENKGATSKVLPYLSERLTE